MTFTYAQKLRWKTVSLTHTVKAANATMIGIDYRGCSKNHILSDMENPKNTGGREKNPAKFAAIMDQLAETTESFKFQLEESVGKIIKAHKST